MRKTDLVVALYCHGAWGDAVYIITDTPEPELRKYAAKVQAENEAKYHDPGTCEVTTLMDIIKDVADDADVTVPEVLTKEQQKRWLRAFSEEMSPQTMTLAKFEKLGITEEGDVE